MSGFSRIHVQGFRRLHDVDLKLRPLNVLIGANSSGKTTLLDVFTLLGASARGGLKKTLNDLGGVNQNLTNLLDFPTEQIRFAVEWEDTDGQWLRYSVGIGRAGASYQLTDETLASIRVPDGAAIVTLMEAELPKVRYWDAQQQSYVESNAEFDTSETALSQISSMSGGSAHLRKGLASVLHYHVLDVSPRAPIRLPQPMRDARLPGENGEDLVSCLYTFRETEPDAFESIENTLRAAFPGFERLNFPPVAAGTLAMTWKETGSKHPFYTHQLSEGTLRFLWLVTLLHSPDLPAVTLIDEPEVSLHPELLSLLADVMREASLRSQLFVATHADRLVGCLKPEEIVAVNVGEHGAAELVRGEDLDLDQWLEEYTLDEIWRLGRLGARP